MNKYSLLLITMLFASIGLRAMDQQDEPLRLPLYSILSILPAEGSSELDIMRILLEDAEKITGNKAAFTQKMREILAFSAQLPERNQIVETEFGPMALGDILLIQLDGLLQTAAIVGRPLPPVPVAPIAKNKPTPTPAPQPTPLITPLFPKPAPAANAVHSAPAPRGLLNGSPGSRCCMNAPLQAFLSLEDLNRVMVSNASNLAYNAGSLEQAYRAFAQTNARSTGTQNALDFCTKGWQLLNAKPGTQQDSLEFSLLLLGRLAHNQPLIAPLFALRTNGIHTATTLYMSAEYAGQQLQNLVAISPQIGTMVRQNPALATLTVAELLQQFRNLNEALARYPALRTLMDDPNTVNAASGQLYLNIAMRNTLKTLDQCFEHATRNAKLTHTSRYLAIGLNRVTVDPVTNTAKKCDQIVPFMLDNFNLNRFAERGTTLPVYRLKAVVLHTGNAFAGHYTSYVRYGAQWYYCNDSVITPVTSAEMELVARNGYGPSIHHLPVFFIYETTTP